VKSLSSGQLFEIQNPKIEVIGSSDAEVWNSFAFTFSLSSIHRNWYFLSSPFFILNENVCLRFQSYPLQKKKLPMEYLREIAHLRARTNTFSAIFRVRNKATISIHNFFQVTQTWWNLFSTLILIAHIYTHTHIRILNTH
jgi:hypothetical protein